MSAPSVLERCRMALAEIGLPMDSVRAGSGETGDELRVSLLLPIETRWLLMCSARPRRPICLPCAVAKSEVQMRAPASERAAISAAFQSACGAWRPFQRESCGATQ